ncbi:tpr domain protein [Chrysochromulina tobinii]|uniref:Tpr domain protein n=1 Tax=Chrysochromulina tobinii TaxID=1460289 RepID=A0A0M0JV20_9EUKA|nr:tpr domain protein [Chrysochromulina tobinii]|eukprot:KOO30511.1 tpr domain protein [Chrysochromulina sp. CCMP291]
MRLRGSGCAISTSTRSTPAPAGDEDCGTADSLADALFDAIAAARVPKGTLDLPVRSHARRLPSGQRGITRKMLRAIRRFYRARGALGMLMGDVCKMQGFEWSVCALTRSTGLSLTESLVLTAEARGEVVDALIGLATTFFSYSWDGTKLGDMLDAIERRLAELEAADGVMRYVWIDMFAASQSLLSGEFDADRYPRGSEERKARKEDTDHIFADAMAAIREILLYCSPLTAEWPAPDQPYFLPDRGAPPAGWMRRGPGAMTRAWCLFELVEALAKGATLHVVLAPADVDGFEELLTDDFDEIAGIVAGIDAAEAQITKIEDRNYILAEVAKLEGGISAVTKTVCASLREWLAAEGRAALMRMPRKKRATSELQMNLGLLLQAQGQLKEAEVLLREVLKARRAMLGNRHEDTLVAINHMASLLDDQGKPDEAEVLYREGLKARRATLGDRHEDTLDAINNLGSLLHSQGKLEEAEMLLLEALEASRATLGDRDPTTLSCISYVAMLLQDQGKFEEAGLMFRKALEASRATLGNRHPDTLSSINNLGSLLQDQGKFEEAEVLLREDVDACRETLGDRHPDTLSAINNLALLLEDQGKFEEAGVLYREDLEASRATLGNRHPETLKSMANLGSLLRNQGKYEEAGVLLREALEASRATLGDRHRETLRAISKLGSLLQDQGKYEEAGVLYREDLEASRATLGDRHRDTLSSINALGSLLQDQGKYEEAGVLYREDLEASRATLGDRHPDTLISIGKLGSLLQDQGKFEEAGVLYREALEASRATLGNRHRDTLSAIGALGSLLQDQGKLKEAEVLLREELDASRATLGDRHRGTLSSIADLGRLLQDQGRLGEAETLLLEALDGCVATFAEGHHARLRSQALLADVRRAQGRIGSARALVDARVLSTAREALGPTGETTLILEAVHARLECAAGGGLDPLKSALERMRTALGPQHSETRRCAVALSEEEDAARRSPVRSWLHG